MNISKKDFKRQYSEYRKRVRNAYFLGKNSFNEALNSNAVFREISFKTDRPVSVKIFLHKNR